MSKLIAGHYYRLTGELNHSGSWLIRDLAKSNKNIFKCYKADYCNEGASIKVLFDGQTLFLRGVDFWEISSEISVYFKEIPIIKQEELDV